MARLPCPPELWPAFSALLDEALELREADRPRWLASLGPEHAAVRPWVAKVIANTIMSREGGFLDRPPVDASPSDFTRGQAVGPYVLEERLGSGGMGEVWLATRGDGTLNRRVALKLPHVHLLAGVLRRRFERERDILAGLSHPHIAQLYDAGVADAQHPYLAMEWVDGVALNEHCRTSGLSLEGRLELFRQILDAVGYAHERLVAHRDLKPSNILVTRDARVKLLDFGIAKLLVDDTENGATQLTRMGSCMATPGYAAPEQLAGHPITAAVDVYALGVILHELLTGDRPYGDANKAAGAVGATPRASSHIRPGHAESVGGMDAQQLRRALIGDLDAIIAKALEADPAHRYRSAEQFAQDIDFSRQHRPISALHIGSLLLARKFVRRHWIGVAMSGGLALALLGGSAGIAWQAVRAEREAQRATTIKDFLIGVFRASDPRIAADRPRGEITARELLDASAGRIESGFARQPETQIELLGVTADIYRELDETQRSTALYAREAELASRYGGVADPHAIDGVLGQANNADHDGDDERSLRLLAQVDPLIRRAHLERSPVRARWLLMHGEALMADGAKAEDARTSLEGAAALFDLVAPRDPLYREALLDLGSLSLDRSQFLRSADYYRRAIDVAQTTNQLDGNLLLAHAGLALALEFLGDFAGAAGAFEHGTMIAERAYGRDNSHYWVIASDWAQFRYDRGERQTALEAFAALLKHLPDARADYRNATNALEAALVLRKYGHCLAIDGQGAQSIALLEQARDLLTTSAQYPSDAVTLQLDLGAAYAAGNHPDEARRAYQAALGMLESRHAPPLQLLSPHERWGRFLLSQGDTQGAAAQFNEVIRLADGRLKAAVVFAQAGLAEIAVLQGDTAAASNGSRRAMEQLDHIEGNYDVRVQPYVWGVRARALWLAGDFARARDLAERSRDAALRYYAPGAASLPKLEPLLSADIGRPTAR